MFQTLGGDVLTSYLTVHNTALFGDVEKEAA